MGLTIYSESDDYEVSTSIQSFNKAFDPQQRDAAMEKLITDARNFVHNIHW